MTFDEAYKKIDEALDKIDFIDLTESIDNVVKELRKEYEPTIEMNEEQERVLKQYKEPGLYDGDYAFYAFYDDTHGHRLSLRNTKLYDNLTEEQLMQAWLHPDSIHIIEE